MRVTAMSGANPSFTFVIKCLMKEIPIKVLCIALSFTIFILTYCLRIFEAPLTEITGQNFYAFSNNIWNVIVTMTTVGYGDIYPKSHMGRFVGIIACMWGVVAVSFLVISI